MKEEIARQIEDSIALKQQMAKLNLEQIQSAVITIVSAYRRGNKLLVFGNGGSAADAQHIAAELVGRYKMDRPALAAVALTTDTSILTAVGNDFGFEPVFSRQVEALAQKGDVLLGISTSGNSANVLAGFAAGKKLGAYNIALTAGSGGSLAAVADLSIIIPGTDTPRIQEAHITVGHIICGLVEKELFKN